MNIKYHARSVLIEAVKWNGYRDTIFPGGWENIGFVNSHLFVNDCLIQTPRGNSLCYKGDYIVKGVDGDFSVVPDHLFDQLYEQVDDLSQEFLEVIMPLKKSKSKKAFKENIKAEVNAGKPVKQAVAIAFSVQRKSKRGSKK